MSPPVQDVGSPGHDVGKMVRLRLVPPCAAFRGVAATAMAFASSIWGFCALRIVIGRAEGGLSSGVMLYLARPRA